MARNIEAHEIKRVWNVTYHTFDQVGCSVTVVSPDIEGARDFIRARHEADWRFDYAEEITTPEQFAAELERVKPFKAQREAAQFERDALAAEKESQARSSAYYAKVTMYRCFIGLGVIATGGWIGSLFL